MQAARFCTVLALELGTLRALPALSLSLIWMSEKAAALLQGEW